MDMGCQNANVYGVIVTALIRIAMKSTSITLAFFASIITLTGCGSSAHIQRADTFMKSGNCDGAIQEVTNGEESPGQRAFLLGAIYHDCKNDNQTANRYLTLAARYGNSSAQQILARIGEPVPPADLANNNTSSGNSALEILNSAVQGWNDGMAKSRANTVKCTTMKYGNYIETECR